MAPRCRVIVLTLLCALLPASCLSQAPARGPLVRALNIRDGDVRDVLRLISQQTGVNIAADETVRGTITLSLNEVTVHQALETILAVKGLYSLQSAPNVFLISAKPLGLALKIKLSDDKARLTLECKEVELKDLLKELGIALGKTLIPDPSVTGKATLQIGDVAVDEGLSLVAVAHGLSVVKTQSAYVFQKFDASRPQRPLPYVGVASPMVRLDVVNATLEECVQALAAQTGVNILPLAPLPDKVSVQFANLPLEEGLKLLLSGTKYTYRKINNYVAVAAPPETKTASTDSNGNGAGPHIVDEERRSTDPGATTPIISVPYYVVGDPSNLSAPGAEKLVRTAVFPLKFMKPEDLPKLLSPLVPAGNLKILKEQNAVSITGTETTLRRIGQEIDLLDVPIPQVMIEAMIMETSENLDKVLGFSYTYDKGSWGADSAAGAIVFDSASELAQRVTGVLKALITKGNAKVLAHPKIATQSGREALMDVGQTRYFRTGILATGGSGGGDPQVGGIFLPQQITTIQVGILLKITPYVGSNGEITVELAPQVDDITGVSPEGLPEVSRRRAQTTLRVHDGATIMLGGLKREEVSRVSQKVPILGQLPLIGFLFQQNQTRKRQSELVMLITPRILRPGPFFQEQGERQRP